MADYMQYVSFDPPAAIVEQASPEVLEQVRLSQNDQMLLKRALEEVSSTPEGMELLRRAAARGPDGKVNFMGNPGGYSLAVGPNDVMLGSEDRTFQYYSNETRQYYNMTAQRFLVHELNHLALGHDHFSLQNEAEAVRHTNAFMKKYYNQPNRDEDTTKGKLETGTADLDFDSNFRRNSDDVRSEYRSHQIRLALQDTPANAVSYLSSELQGLYRLKDDSFRFDRQFALIENTAKLEGVMKEVDTLTAGKPVSRIPATTFAAANIIRKNSLG